MLLSVSEEGTSERMTCKLYGAQVADIRSAEPGDWIRIQAKPGKGQLDCRLSEYSRDGETWSGWHIDIIKTYGSTEAYLKMLQTKRKELELSSATEFLKRRSEWAARHSAAKVALEDEDTPMEELRGLLWWWMNQAEFEARRGDLLDSKIETLKQRNKQNADDRGSSKKVVRRCEGSGEGEVSKASGLPRRYNPECDD